MTHQAAATYTAFHHHQLLARGSLEAVALACHRAGGTAAHDLLIFSDETGRQVDVDLSGSPEEVKSRLPAWRARFETPAAATAKSPEPRGRGRPALGVVAREVTLLPRHWDWLMSQPGGASVALRKLVEEARRAPNPAALRKLTQERVYRFLSGLAGDFAAYEEALRALFAHDRPHFEGLTAAWPADIRTHALALWDGR